MVKRAIPGWIHPWPDSDPPRPVKKALSMKSQDVVFISHEASRTGAPIILLHLLRWLRANTDLSFGVVLVLGGPIEEEFRRLAPVWVLVPDRLRAPASSRWRRRLQDIAIRLRRRWIRSRVSKTRPSLFYYNTVNTGWVAESFASLGVASIYHIHELDWAIRMVGTHYITDMNRRGVPFLAGSFAVGASLKANYGVADENLTVVPEFIEMPTPPAGDLVEARREFRDRVGIPHDAAVVGGVGSTELRKGVDLLAKVAALLPKTKDGRPVHFVWLGGAPDGPFARQVKADAVRDGAGDRFHFLANSPRPFEVMTQFDVFAMTSREEALGIVMLEAATLGKPIVCFNGSGGPPEFVGDDAGFVVPHLDVRAMADRIAELLEDPALMAKMASAGKAKVEEQYTVDRAAPRILEVIRRELKTSGPTRAGR